MARFMIPEDEPGTGVLCSRMGKRCRAVSRSPGGDADAGRRRPRSGCRSGPRSLKIVVLARLLPPIGSDQEGNRFRKKTRSAGPVFASWTARTQRAVASFIFSKAGTARVVASAQSVPIGMGINDFSASDMVNGHSANRYFLLSQELPCDRLCGCQNKSSRRPLFLLGNDVLDDPAQIGVGFEEVQTSCLYASGPMEEPKTAGPWRHG